MKVLIVESHAGMRSFLRLLVGRLAEAIYECVDGIQAIETYTAAHLTTTDWVLMSIDIPRLDGLQATQQLKSICPDARVCLFTDHNLPECREAAVAMGASGYVLMDELHTVRRLLGAQ